MDREAHQSDSRFGEYHLTCGQILPRIWHCYVQREPYQQCPVHPKVQVHLMVFHSMEVVLDSPITLLRSVCPYPNGSGRAWNCGEDWAVQLFGEGGDPPHGHILPHDHPHLQIPHGPAEAKEVD